MDDIIRRVGRRIQQTRHDRSLTQEGLAERVGLAPPTLSRIERGRQAPSLVTLEKIASALRVSTAHLVATEDDIPPAEDAIDALFARLPPGEVALHSRIRAALRALAGE